MSMVVQHNLTAMNANRMLGVTSTAQAKSTEKLSSGYKINRAADDAAGLAISEKMRKQIRGLTQASANAQDGISTVQTAEGALNEVQDMLQRMNELAVKSANGTNSESDRNAIQAEVDQLVTEIDRVSTTTKFNETYLLKGNNAGSVGHLSYHNVNSTLKTNLAANSGAWDPVTGTGKIASGAVASSDVDADHGLPTNTTINGQKFVLGNTTYVLVESTSATGAGDFSNVADTVKSINDDADNKTGSGDIKAFSSIDDLTAAVKASAGTDIKNVSTFMDGSKGSATLALRVETFADLNDPVDLSLHVGADSSADNKIKMNIAQMGARGLGINGIEVSGETADKATKAIDTITAALAKVSTQRASLGAIQNRLEHTIKNLDNVVENTQSAESKIRDTDMASEMVTYSKNNILQQAGQSMLAQANQSNQGVLSILG